MLSRERTTILERKWLLPLALAVLAIYAFLLRSLHLLSSGHYYVISADSYYFHWLARRVMAGEGPPSPPGEDIYTLHSGLAYPVAYVAKAVSYVFGVSSGDALEFVTKFLPPLLAVISLVVVYLIAAKIYNRKVGLFSAFVWASILHAITFGAAGYVDRDGLSMLLLIVGASLFYFSSSWHLRVANKDVGWLIAGLGVLIIEGLLYLEWTFVGPVVLLAVILAYFLLKLLLQYLARLEKEPRLGRRLTGAMKEVNWRTLLLIVLGNIVVLALYHHQAAEWFGFISKLFQARGGIAVVELKGIGVYDLLAYGFLLIPIVVALYNTWKKRADKDLFFASWFLFLVILSFFAKRVLLYAAPAACFLAGVGLASIWDWKGWEPFTKRADSWFFEAGISLRVMRGWSWVEQHGQQVVAGFILCLVILFSIITAVSIGASPTMAVDKEWQGALAYVREETPRDVVVMTQWSWGYWILDLGNLDGGQRRPLVDNGYYLYDSARLHDIGIAYTTSDPAQAAELMRKWGADYLIFSTLDRNTTKTIMGWAGITEDNEYFPSDSLFERSLRGEFESAGGLQVVYRSVPEPGIAAEPEVVILGLVQSDQL